MKFKIVNAYHISHAILTLYREDFTEEGWLATCLSLNMDDNTSGDDFKEFVNTLSEIVVRVDDGEVSCVKTT